MTPRLEPLDVVRRWIFRMAMAVPDGLLPLRIFGQRFHLHLWIDWDDAEAPTRLTSVTRLDRPVRTRLDPYTVHDRSTTRHSGDESLVLGSLLFERIVVILRSFGRRDLSLALRTSHRLPSISTPFYSHDFWSARIARKCYVRRSHFSSYMSLVDSCPDLPPPVAELF